MNSLLKELDGLTVNLEVPEAPVTQLPYQPLNAKENEFRLFELIPSEDFSAPIHCKLYPVPISKAGEYEALSYVWGDADDKVTIIVNGIEFRVTRNLGIALRYMRLPTGSRTLWVDAICINQEDDKERASQVQQMRKIYLGVVQVVVWLGEDENEDAEEILGVFANADEKMKMVKRLVTAEERQRFSKFFHRTWWTRLWVLQEVIHHRAVTAYVGHCQLSIDDLCYRILLFTHAVEFIRRFSRGQQQRRNDVKSKVLNMWFDMKALLNISRAIMLFRKDLSRNETWSLQMEEALIIFRGQHCADDRDRIFALLGLIPPLDAESVRVDYSTSKRVLYTSVMWHLLVRPKSKALLFVQSPQRQICSDIPSWVVDWSTQNDFLSNLTQYARKFDASLQRLTTGRRPLPGLPGRPDTLLLSGVKIGSITHVTWLELQNEKDSIPWRLKLFKYARLTDDDDDNDDDEHGKLDISTSTEMTGLNSSWGPPQAEPGDIIVLSKLSTLPLVVRQSGDAHLFVGICCLVDSELQGVEEKADMSLDPGFSSIMHGSAWDESKLEDFYII